MYAFITMHRYNDMVLLAKLFIYHLETFLKGSESCKLINDTYMNHSKQSLKIDEFWFYGHNSKRFDGHTIFRNHIFGASFSVYI